MRGRRRATPFRIHAHLDLGFAEILSEEARIVGAWPFLRYRGLRAGITGFT